MPSSMMPPRQGVSGKADSVAREAGPSTPAAAATMSSQGLRVAYMRAAVAKCDGKTVVQNFGGHVDHYDRARAVRS